MTSQTAHDPDSESDASEEGYIPGALQALTLAVAQRPVLTLTMVALLTVIAVGVSARFLTFKTNRADLISPDTAFQQRWLKFVEKFGDDSDVVIVVEGENAAAIQPVLDHVGTRLEAEKELFHRVLYRVDVGALRSKAMQFLSPMELEAAYNRLAMYAPILEGHWDRAGLDSYCRRLADQIEQRAQQGALSENDGTLVQAEALSASLLNFLKDPRGFTNPWPEVVSASSFPAMDEFGSHYQITPSGKMGFVLALPRNVSTNFSGSAASLSRLDEIVAEAKRLYPQTKIGLTGIPILEADEMRRSQSDMAVASIISFVGVLLISLIGFRGLRHPLLSMTMLAIGLAWSLGYTTVVVGHLNILSLSFATILIGLGDYGTHYLARYLEIRHHGRPLVDALVRTSGSVGTGIITAAVTMALAFYSSTFTNFLGVAELGIIAGGGILICAILTFLVLPPLVVLADRNLEPRQLPTPFQGHLLRWTIRRFPGLLTAASVAVIVVVGLQAITWKDGHLALRARYDYNLLNLQAKGLESVNLQERIFEEANGSLLYAVSMADSPQQARLRKEKFLALPTVSRVEDLASYLPAYPATETNLLVQSIHARLSGISEFPRALPQVNPQSIGQALERLYLTLRQRPELIAQQGAAQLDFILSGLEQPSLEQQIQLLGGYQQALLMALHQQFQVLASIANPEPISAADFPEAVRNRFVSKQGDWLLRVYPSEQIWDEAPLRLFVNHVRSVDPDMTGTPLQNYEAAGQIQESYLDAAIYALAVITAVLLIDALSIGPLVVSLGAPLAVIGLLTVLLDRSPFALGPVWLIAFYLTSVVIIASVFDFSSVATALLALLPPLAGLCLLFGILGIAGINLNPANLIVLPLILGIGMDSGVYVIHGYRLNPRRYETAPSTINAVMLTSLTTMVGFGSMIVAAHQGLVSLGIVLVIGVGSCLFISLVLLPAILTLISKWHDAAGSAGEQSETDELGPARIVPLPGVRLTDVA